MGNEVANNAAGNYYETLAKAGLSANQLSRLDALNSQKGDKVIDKDVFTVAQSILNGTQLEGEISQNAALVQEVNDIMHGDVDISQIKEEFEETPGAGINPETLMAGLHISKAQADKLLALSKKLTGNENVVDRSVASAAICIVRGQPAPNGIPQEMNSRIQEILGGNRQQTDGGFGV